MNDVEAVKRNVPSDSDDPNAGPGPAAITTSPLNPVPDGSSLSSTTEILTYLVALSDTLLQHLSGARNITARFTTTMDTASSKHHRGTQECRHPLGGCISSAVGGPK